MGVRQKSVRLKETYASTVANLPVMVAGMQAGFPAFIMPQLESEIDLDVDQISWLVFIGYFSLLFGPIIVAFIINKYSRRTNLRLTLCLFITGWSIILISANFITLIIGTVICGIAAGASLPLASTYVSEICRAKYRGPLLAMVWVIGIVGTVTVYILEFSLPWRGVVLIAILISAFGIYQIGKIPESKFWYLFQHRKEDALKSAAWFENTKVALKEVEILYTLIKFGKHIAREDDFKFATMSYNAIKNLPLKPFALTIIVSVLRCGTGKVFFTVYPVNMFGHLGTPYDGKILGIWFGVLSFLSCIVNLVIFTTIDRFNRKHVFYVFNMIMIVCLTAIIGLKSLSGEEMTQFPKLILLFMYAYLLAESTGYFSILSVMVVELMPMMQRPVSFSINFFIINIVMAIYVKLFPLIEHQVAFRTFCLYFLTNILIILTIVEIFIPETRGKMFTGYEKLMMNAIRNGDIDKIISNDWLRNEELQRFLTEDEHFNIDFLNNEAIQNISKEVVEQLRDIMVKEKPVIDKYLENVEQSYEIVDETKEANQPLLERNEEEPVIVEQLFDTMKNTFNVLMDKNPWIGQNDMWKANKNMIYQHQEWIKNTWIKGGSSSSKSERKSQGKSFKIVRPKGNQSEDIHEL